MPFIINNGNYQELLSGYKSIPLAVMKYDEQKISGMAYINQTVNLNQGSKLLLYTDGLIEAVSLSDSLADKKASDFESAGLNSAIAELINVNCVEFVYSLFEKLVDFRGSNTFDDDICMICLDVI